MQRGDGVPDWSGEPAYKQVAGELRARIADGRLAVGSQLPSVTQLQGEFDVSITVVRMALAELRAEGLVATHQGKGAFVLDTASPRGSGELSELRAEVRDLAERVSALEAGKTGRKANR